MSAEQRNLANHEQITEFARQFAESMKEPLSIGPERRRVLAQKLNVALTEQLDRR